MCGFLLRIVINAVMLFLLISELPGIFVDTLGGMMLGAAIVGIVNAALRPLLLWAAKPLSWRNLGGAAFCTNILIPLAVIEVLPGYQINNMLAPIISIMFMTVCSMTLSKVIHDR